MYVRTIYKEIEAALKLKQVIAIIGLRRVGKTTAIHYLFNKINSLNKLYFDLERVEYRVLFGGDNYQHIVQALEAEGIDFSKKSYIAIDEIQLVPNITSVVKYLYDTYNIKFIVTGSSSFYLKNHFTESLAGRKLIFEMFPLSFNEFLLFKENHPISPVKQLQTININIYNKYYKLYKEYIEYGGFPEVVLAKRVNDKINLLKDIVNSYLNIDIQFLADFTKKDEIYKIIALLTSRVGSKIDYSKLSSITGINRKLIKEYLLFFEQTYLIRQVPAFVISKDREIALQKKMYFVDNGFLTLLGKPSFGMLLENSLANQLALKAEIRYYARKDGQEIDFILNNEIAIEVKETPASYDLETLKARATSIGIKKYYLIGMNQVNTKFKNFVWAGDV